MWSASISCIEAQRIGPENILFTRGLVKEEAADLITAALALCNAHGICWEEVEEEIVRKGKEKGGFGGGFVMEISE